MIISDEDIMIVESYFEGKEYVKLSVNGIKKNTSEDKVIGKISQEDAPQNIPIEEQKKTENEQVAAEIIQIEQKPIFTEDKEKSV